MVKQYECKKCGSNFILDDNQIKDEKGRTIVWCSEPCRKQLHVCECKKCFKEFYSLYSYSKFCSEECKRVDCLVCNKQFLPYGRYKNCCSEVCQQKYYTHKCHGCGEEFYKEIKGAKYCSKECRAAHSIMKKNARYLVCKNCKGVFAFIDETAQYCSPKCRVDYVKKVREKKLSKFTLFDEEEKKELKEIINSRVEILLKRRQEIEENLVFNPNYWNLNGFNEDIKEKVRQRDGYACYVCEDTNSLEVHHIVPRRLGGNHEEKNLITLCTKCHRAIETGNSDHATAKCLKKALTTLGVVKNKKSNYKDVIFDSLVDLNKLYREIADRNAKGEFEEALMTLDDVLDRLQEVKL